jgi:hypothetical protein
MTPPNVEYVTRCRVRSLRALLLRVINQGHKEPPIPPALYRLIQYGHHVGTGALEWLNANGCHELTICPVCHAENFTHISDCTELLYGGTKA